MPPPKHGRGGPLEVQDVSFAGLAPAATEGRSLHKRQTMTASCCLQLWQFAMATKSKNQQCWLLAVCLSLCTLPPSREPAAAGRCLSAVTIAMAAVEAVVAVEAMAAMGALAAVEAAGNLGRRPGTGHTGQRGPYGRSRLPRSPRQCSQIAPGTGPSGTAVISGGVTTGPGTSSSNAVRASSLRALSRHARRKAIKESKAQQGCREAHGNGRVESGGAWAVWK